MSQARDHQGMEVLAPDECWSLLASVPVGRVAFVEAGEPVVLPVNHTAVGHRVAFRTTQGALLHEALMDRQVAFEVDDYDAGERSGWSVLVRGRAMIADEETESELDRLDVDPWADSVARNDWVVVLPDEVTGRRIVH